MTSSRRVHASADRLASMRSRACVSVSTWSVTRSSQPTRSLLSAPDVGAAFGSPSEIGRVFLSDHLLAFEITSILLVIAVVGAVLLSRRSRRDDEIVDPGQEERVEEIAERMDEAEHRAHPELYVGNGHDDGGDDEDEADAEPEEVGR